MPDFNPETEFAGRERRRRTDAEIEGALRRFCDAATLRDWLEGLWIAVRNWLIRRLAGRSSIMLNVTVSGDGTVQVGPHGALVAHCEFISSGVFVPGAQD